MEATVETKLINYSDTVQSKEETKEETKEEMKEVAQADVYTKLVNNNNTGIYTEENKCKIKRKYQHDREFIMGCASDLVGKLKESEINLSVNSEIVQFFLVDKPALHLRVILDNIREMENGIVGIEYDNMRMAVDFNKEDKKFTELIIESNDYIYFKEIELQHLYFEHVGTNPVQHYLSVNYLRLIDSNDKIYEIGIKKQEGTIEEHEYKDDGRIDIDDTYKKKFGDKYNIYKVIYGESTIENGHLLFTGFMFSRGGLLGIQVVDKVHDENRKVDEKDLLDIYRLSDHQGIYEVQSGYHVWNEALKATLLCKKMFYGELIGLENEKIFNIFVNLYEDTFWYKDVRNSILPKFFQLIAQCINNDVATIHSILSLQRFINHTIQTEMVSNGICNEDKKSILFKKLKRFGRAFGEFGTKKQRMYLPHLVKARYIWSHLFEVIQIINYLLYYEPSPDIFTNTYLNPTKIHYVTLISTFIAQILLFILVLTSIEFDQIGQESISILVSALMVTIVFALVWKQIRNIFDFLKVFPNSIKHPVIIMGFCINVILGILLIPLNVLILASTSDHLDLVLNALAILFILELDDQVIDGENMQSVYLSYFQGIIINKLENCDTRYIQKFENCQGEEIKHKIDPKTCHILWHNDEK